MQRNKAQRIKGMLRVALDASPDWRFVKAYLGMLQDEGEDPQAVYEELVREKKAAFPYWGEAPGYQDLWPREPSSPPAVETQLAIKPDEREGEGLARMGIWKRLFPNVNKAVSAKPSSPKRIHCALSSVQAGRPKLPRARCYIDGHPLVETPRRDSDVMTRLLIVDAQTEKMYIMEQAARKLNESKSGNPAPTEDRPPNPD